MNESNWLDELLENKSGRVPEPFEDVPERPSNQSRELVSARLDWLCSKLDIRNNQMAKSLNVDNSLISRWRNNERRLTTANPMQADLLDYLSRQVQDYVNNSGELGGCSSCELIMKKPELTREILNLWLFPQPPETNLTHTIERFLQNLLMLSDLQKVSPWQDAEVLQARLEKNPYLARFFKHNRSQARQGLYHGIEGFREIVIRFLMEVAESSSPRQLQLFSNQNMRWITEDQDFLRAWAFLMKLILQQGHHIEIVHYFDRTQLEMVTAIQEWLPLYLSGHIQPYYLEAKEDVNHSSDSLQLVQTYFINRGKSAIRSQFYAGTEDHAIYEYSRKKGLVDFLSTQFEYLRDQAKTLGRFYMMPKSIGQKMEENKVRVGEAMESRCFYVASQDLPLYLLPKSSLLYLAGKGLLGESEDSLLKIAELGQAILDAAGKDQRWKIILPAQMEQDSVSLSLFPFSEERVQVTEEDYSLVLNHLIESVANMPHVNLVLHEREVSTRFSIFLDEQSFVQIYSAGHEAFLIEVEHSSFCEAFELYLETFFSND